MTPIVPVNTAWAKAGPARPYQHTQWLTACDSTQFFLPHQQTETTRPGKLQRQSPLTWELWGCMRARGTKSWTQVKVIGKQEWECIPVIPAFRKRARGITEVSLGNRGRSCLKKKKGDRQSFPPVGKSQTAWKSCIQKKELCHKIPFLWWIPFKAKKYRYMLSPLGMGEEESTFQYITFKPMKTSLRSLVMDKKNFSLVACESVLYVITKLNQLN
jgi:hypothetical protein